MLHKIPVILVFVSIALGVPLNAQNRTVEQKDVEEALLQKIRRLTDYINYCGANETDLSTKEESLSLILKEFLPTATMQVSNVKSGKKSTSPVKDYFRRLIYLKESNNYSLVFFSFSNIRVKSFKNIGGNKYMAVGEYTQTFKAFKDGNEPYYADRTVKFSEIFVTVSGANLDLKIGNTTVFSTEKFEEIGL